MGKKSTKCLDYILKTVKIIVNAGIHAVFVFDGQMLPSKKVTNDKRVADREERRKEAIALLKMGNKEEALKKFRGSYSISKECQAECIEVLSGIKGVDVIVAPYEADAELTFLVNSGLAYAAITLDSDLLAFGCMRVIYNLNVDSAMCEVIQFPNIRSCFSQRLQSSFNSELLRYMCILRGCDYFGGLKGMAFKNAEKFFSIISDRNPKTFIRHIKSVTKINVPNIEIFVNEFIRANNTFLYQIIFDPRDGCQKPLNPYPEDLIKEFGSQNSIVDSLESDSFFWYAGKIYPPDIARLLAVGNQFEEILKNNIRFKIPQNVSFKSIWKYLTGGRSPLRIKREPSTCSLSQSLPRKRRNSSNIAEESEIISSKRCLMSNTQVFGQDDSSKENNKLTNSEGNTIYDKQQHLKIELISQNKQKSPLNELQRVNSNSKVRKIIIRESKYFKSTSENVETKLFKEDVSSSILYNRITAKPNFTRSQERR